MKYKNLIQPAGRSGLFRRARWLPAFAALLLTLALVLSAAGCNDISSGSSIPSRPDPSQSGSGPVSTRPDETGGSSASTKSGGSSADPSADSSDTTADETDATSDESAGTADPTAVSGEGSQTAVSAASAPPPASTTKPPVVATTTKAPTSPPATTTKPPPPPATTKPPAPTTPPPTQPPAPAVNRTQVLVPTNPGILTESNASCVLDMSNASEGYVMITYTGSRAKVAIQITKAGSDPYTYYSTPNKIETIPLTQGSGSYKVSILENVTGNTYSNVLTTNISANIGNALRPFLYPSQYVNFNASTQAVRKGTELAAGNASDLKILENIYNFITGNITYDYNKAASVQSGYLPNPDNTLSTKTGICFDYAVLMCTMLRTQGIPARLEIGYVGGATYHAWLSVYTAEKGWINSMIQFNSADWLRMDPTYAAGDKSASMASYIGNNANYKIKYMY
ncbi:MAG: transglutaminase-like domain-containing protein [Oscillospiraceae bacterium]|nr:transglutaminase-like domain-containing protein [Oscillospiraceae bacterium]